MKITNIDVSLNFIQWLENWFHIISSFSVAQPLAIILNLEINTVVQIVDTYPPK